MAQHKHQGAFVIKYRRPLTGLGILILISLLGFLLAIVSGNLSFSVEQYIAALFGNDTEQMATRVIHELRLPRAMLAFITGGLLAMAGALLQVLLRNPLADPYVLGISGGAAVFALVCLALGLVSWQVNIGAFIGALLAMLLVFGLSHGHGSWSPTRLLLTGIVLAAGWGAIISFILSVAPQSQLRSMLFWLMGDLSYASYVLPGFIVLLTGLLLSLMTARHLNVLALGALQAGALGVPVERLRWQIYVLASLLTAAAVVQAGSIGFIGLIVPHMLRLTGMHDYRFLLPASVLAGGSLLIIADTLARSMFTDINLPVGVITAAIGVPVFIFLLYRGSRM
jgi:iron complex transport system permease protein